ncbi:MAG TPA: hypothetical protein V6D08_13700 [Candidatus Obscuribacterales bacterium]
MLLGFGNVDQIVINDGQHKDEVFETYAHRQKEQNDWWANLTKDLRHATTDWHHPDPVDTDSTVSTEIRGIGD